EFPERRPGCCGVRCATACVRRRDPFAAHERESWREVLRRERGSLRACESSARFFGFANLTLRPGERTCDGDARGEPRQCGAWSWRPTCSWRANSPCDSASAEFPATSGCAANGRGSVPYRGVLSPSIAPCCE